MISESLRKIVKKSNILAILFALVAIFSVSNISSQIEEGRIIPFGILNNVFAEFSRSAPNSTKLAKNLSTSSNIQDQSDRCQIVDPNRPDILTAWEYEGVSGAQIKGDNIAGANPGVSYGAGFDAPKDETVRDYASSLGMSYNLAIFSAPNEVGNAIAFVNANIDAGFIPIVRLCVAVADSCQFNSPNDVIGFYTALHDGANGEFIAMVGPNEPGTGEDGYIEMNGFGGINSYAQIINFVNEAATGLQKYRSINGGKMYLSPGAFNLTNPINRDVYEYLYNPSNPKLKINLFDYLMGNVYAQGEPAVKNVPYPYATYRDGENHDGNGLGNFAEENNIPVILTEFGIFKEAGDSKTVLLNEAIESFKLFCADETIAGVLFFQSFLNDDGTVLISDIEQRKEFHGLTKQEHSLIIGDCTKSSPFKDWAWANCNFDSCIYKDYEYDPKSTASACGVEDKPLTGDGKPALKVVCSNGICSTRAIKTIDIGMPIRHFGGNSLNGSPTHQYPSICSELSTQFANKNYDTINQFAGVINMGGTQYPMPWLGSAINCASQLLLATQEFAYLTPDKYTFNPHPGSKIEEIVNEINSDEIYGMPWETYNGAIPGEPLYDAAPTMNETRSIIDEAAICLMRDEATDLDDRLFCLDKRKNPNQVFAFNDYDPYKSDLEWEKSTCNTNMVYRKDPKNMIYGPEIQVSDIETVETISESELCYEFARRNSEGVTSKILAGVDYPRYFPDGDTSNATPNCQIDRTKFVNGVSCAALSCSSSDILKGKCKADLRFKDCFNYVNSSQSSEHQIYLKADSNVFAQVPQIEIEGIYDALYWMYLRTQNSFKNKKYKIVFRENIGMNVEVNSKIRDANRGKDDALNPKFPAGESENLYAQELNSCEVPDNMYSYNNLLAKNSPIKTQYQYFDWLGYLDILQEIQKVYFGNTILPDINFEKNLDFGTEGAPNSDREFILVSGSALKTMSYPLFTCDELNLRIAKDPYFTLYGNENLKITCVTDLSDERYSDELGEFLCSKGYEVPGICDNLFCPVQASQVNTGNVVEDGIIDEGGVYVKIDKDAKYVASQSNGGSIVEPIENFVEKTGASVAINANLYNQFGVPEGLYGGQGQISYVVPGPERSDYKISMLIGNLNTDAPYIAGNVVAERDNKFYLVDISKWNALDANTINALTQGTLAGIDVAITGSAIVGVDSQIYKDYTTMSLEEFNQKHSYSDYLQKTVRTIIGWDNRSNVVFLILDNADFYTMLEKSAEVGISYGIVMDGGVSSQLFYENGFENVDSKLRENNPKVYDPSGQGRSVAGYVGAILNQTSQQLTRASATGNFSLIYPTDYKEIEHESLDYGYERSETWTHAGLDFVGTKGSPIYASASGTVIVARPVEPNHNRDAQPYGNFVMIEHSNGYVTLYAHLDKISVKKGDIVLAGDTIGTMGNTGNVYCEGNRRPSGPDDDTCGVHLHFELRKNKNCKWDGNPLTSVFGSCTMDPKPFLSGSVRGRQVFCGVDNTLNLDQTGVLGCNLNIKDINDNPDFAKLTPIISTRIKSYNLDDNLSHTWLYSPYESEELFNQIKDQKFNGSFDAAKLHAQFRKEVTDFVISKSKQLGVNPRLALTLWIEESGGSALGRAAMGCLYFRGTAQETSTLPLDYDPLDESYKQKTLDHLNEQIECLASYVNEFDNFREFMCTYSGESDRKNCQIFTNNPNFPVNVCRIYNYQEQKF